MSDCTLTLYVNKEFPRSEQAIATVKELCRTKLTDCSLEIVDVQEQPEKAERNNVSFTPTLIRKSPSFLKRVVGNLKSKSNVLNSMNHKTH